MILLIYFISNGEHIKIGYTSKSIEKRLKQLNTGSPEKLFLCGWQSGDMKLEKKLHKQFHKYNHEWFVVNEPLLVYINENSELNLYVDLLDGNVVTYSKMQCVR